MRRRERTATRMTAQQLVDAVAAAGLAERPEHPAFVGVWQRQLEAFLDELGYDFLFWVRARVAVKAAGFAPGSLGALRDGVVWDAGAPAVTGEGRRR